MRLLVLGGTRFVGRALVEDALVRGWQVTTLNRGRTGAPPHGVEALVADRTDSSQLRDVIAHRSWDIVVDTWSAAPATATASAAVLEGRADHFGYVSSSSVYEWGAHVDETSPVVGGDPRATEADYAGCKRGAELGVLLAFPDAVLARAGLILGPHEDIGRLPWWLTRVARGGQVVAPGRPGRPLQYVDARDLASWLLTSLAGGTTGAFDVISRSGHATMRELLNACQDATGSDAEFIWIDEQRLEEAGAEPWTQLPCWVPEHGEFAGFLEADTTKAARAGLVCRAIGETVRDTWAWLQGEGPLPQRADRPVHGLPADVERRLLT